MGVWVQKICKAYYLELNVVLWFQRFSRNIKIPLCSEDIISHYKIHSVCVCVRVWVCLSGIGSQTMRTMVMKLLQVVISGSKVRSATKFYFKKLILWYFWGIIAPEEKILFKQVSKSTVNLCYEGDNGTTDL